MYNFEKLEVWQKTREFAKKIYQKGIHLKRSLGSLNTQEKAQYLFYQTLPKAAVDLVMSNPSVL